MKALKLFQICFLALFAMLSYSQEACKVLMPQISGQYIGKCKKGLAHGKGLALGIDRYDGTFKNGYPSGRGVYTWSDGTVYDGEWKQGKRSGKGTYSYVEDGKAEILTGIWEDDRYIGQVPEKPKVQASTGIERYNFQRHGDGTQITINLFINGSNNNSVEDLSVTSSSGTIFRSGGTFGIQSIVFPFTCKISYYSWNKMHTSRVYTRFEFKITEQGRWVLDLHNN